MSRLLSWLLLCCSFRLPLIHGDDCDGSMTDHRCPTGIIYHVLNREGRACTLHCGESPPWATTYRWFNCSDCLPQDNPAILFIPYVEVGKGKFYRCVVSGRNRSRTFLHYLSLGEEPRAPNAPISFSKPQGNVVLDPESGGHYLWSVQLRNIDYRRSAHFRLRLESVQSAGPAHTLVDCTFNPFCEDGVYQRPAQVPLGACRRNRTLASVRYRANGMASMAAELQMSPPLNGTLFRLSVCTCAQDGSCSGPEQEVFARLSSPLIRALYCAGGAVLITVLSALLVLAVRTICWRELRFRCGSYRLPDNVFLIHAESTDELAAEIVSYLSTHDIQPQILPAGASYASAVVRAIADTGLQIVVIDTDSLNDERFVYSLQMLRTRGTGQHFYLLRNSLRRLHPEEFGAEVLEWLKVDAKRHEILKGPRRLLCLPKRLYRLWFARQVFLCSRLTMKR